MAISSWSHPGSRWQAERAHAKAAKVRRFAEALADCGVVGQAARAVGISQQTGSLYFRQICADIDGPQAAAGYGQWTR